MTASAPGPRGEEFAETVTVFDGIDGLRAAVGTRLGHSDWCEIGQDRVNAFAAATDDHQWIHVNVERAGNGPFGAPVAHGHLVLSLVPSLLRTTFRTTGLAMEINYGLNRVRFPSPAVVPCRIRAAVDLVGVEPAGEAFLATMHVVIEAESGGRPICIAECLGYLVPA